MFAAKYNPANRVRPTSGEREGKRGMRGISTVRRAMSLRSLVVACAALSLIAVPSIQAQEVGASLNGTVKDPNGLGVAGAAVQATNQATGIRTNTTSSETGDYVLPSLTPGTYRLTVEKPGFKTAVLNDITLVVFQRARLDVNVEV